MPNETSNSLTHPEQCHKFQFCNATYCPLDAQRSKRAIHRDDPVCFYLLEVEKTGAKERILAGHSEQFYEVISQVYLEAINTACPIKKSLLRARNTPSRMHSVGNLAVQVGERL
jgi:hypothetical protein